MDSPRTATILYVDDEEANRRSVAWYFRTVGFEVREAATGKEALRLAAEKPDLVILDINLPDINGFEVCRRIKAHPATATIPVLHVSALFVDSQDRCMGLDGGADGYLVKPVQPEELLAHVQALLRVHRAEQAARLAARQWHATFDALNDGICLLDPNGIVLRCNQALADLLGAPRATLVDAPLAPRLQTAFGLGEVPLLQAARQAHSRVSTELEAGERWLRLTVDPVMDESGQLAGTVHLFADLTEHRRLEEQLRQVQKTEAIGRLAGGVAHDFNNLLTAITGNVSLLRADSQGRPELDESLGMIEKAAWRAAELVRQLLTFSRQTTLRPQPLHLAAAIEEMLGFLGRTIDPRIVVEVEAPRDLWPVEADPSQINQLLMNLCLNARDAMPQGGCLRLEAANIVIDERAAQRSLEARPGAFVRLAVVDNGHGIPAALLPRIFDPFFTTKEIGRGTGLGLATVLGIVRQHRGWIECTSAVGQGTRFDVYLPRGLEQPPTMPTATAPEAAAPGGEMILLADDDPALRQLGRTILERHGYCVLVADDGQQAVEIYRERWRQIDLVILDLTMPRLSGREALERLRQINPAARVLLASGYAAGLEPSTLPVYGLLDKPYRAPDLARLVRDALDRDLVPA
jgi:PAS domain S-box-containing protein